MGVLPMPRIRLDHIAIALPRIADAPSVLVAVLGGVPERIQPAGVFRWASWTYAGGGRIEILEPMGADGFVHRFLAAHGPGVHHVTFKVPELDVVCRRAQHHGYRIVGRDESDPSWKEAFFHPKQALGIVVQLAEAGPSPAGAPEDLAPGLPDAPAPARILGLRMRAHSRERALTQWRDILQAEVEADLAAGSRSAGPARRCGFAWRSIRARRKARSPSRSRASAPGRAWTRRAPVWESGSSRGPPDSTRYQGGHPMDVLTTDLRALLIGMAGSTAQAAGHVLLVLVAGYFGARVLRTLIAHLEHALVVTGERTGALPGVTRSRVATLTSVLRTLSLVALWSVVAVICLSELGLDVRPILAGAGIVGLAVGFGAQHLVRDVIAGFFLVLEDQVRVGDVAVVNGTGGLVETVTFRTIVLRDVVGTVHIFPNGSVTTLANMTKGWSGYVVDVEVGYREDPDRIVSLMRRVFEELRQHPSTAP